MSQLIDGNSQETKDRDTYLIGAVAKGDLAAFAEIYSRYRNRLFGFIYRSVPSTQVAEDLTQDVFLTLIEHPERYEAEKASIFTFLCTIAHRRMVDHMRKNGRRLEGAEGFDEELANQAGPAASATPFEGVAQTELRQIIENALSSLPPLQREVVLLREAENLSYDEIALIVGSTAEMVKARLYRARRLLANRLAPLIGGKHGV